MALPIFQGKEKEMSLMQTAWASALNPVIDMPISKGFIIPNVKLVTGFNQIDHKLRRNLLGWFVVRQRASATIFDTQDSNQHPDMVLFLNASAPVVVDLF